MSHYETKELPLGGDIVRVGRYRTRSGNEARIYAVDGSEGDQVVHGAVLFDGSDGDPPGWYLWGWDKYGGCERYTDGEQDLVERIVEEWATPPLKLPTHAAPQIAQMTRLRDDHPLYRERPSSSEE